MKLRAAGLSLLLVCCAAMSAADSDIDKRVMRVADELRCLVCQNETVAASQSGLAIDLRQQIRSQLQQGKSEAQIVDYMVERYGDFVRYRPAFGVSTALLWLGPFVLLAAVAGLLLKGARRKPPPLPEALNAAELRRVDELLRP